MTRRTDKTKRYEIPFRSPPENLVLRAAFHSRRLKGELRHVTFEVGDELWTAQDPVTYVLFPLRGVISSQISSDGGKRVDVAMLGREGYAEVPFLFGADHSVTAMIALTGGEALTMELDLFRSYLRDHRFRDPLQQYARTFVTMLSQFSACHRVHVIEQGLISRLLLMQDRTHTDSFYLTQEFLSRIVGVRKATVSQAAAHLQNDGLIRYDRRGRLTILDRRLLERKACACYGNMKSDCDDLIATLGGY